jgi:hypothetical protein
VTLAAIWALTGTTLTFSPTCGTTGMRPSAQTWLRGASRRCPLEAASCCMKCCLRFGCCCFVHYIAVCGDVVLTTGRKGRSADHRVFQHAHVHLHQGTSVHIQAVGKHSGCCWVCIRRGSSISSPLQCCWWSEAVTVTVGKGFVRPGPHMQTNESLEQSIDLNLDWSAPD